jgi:hypothetical protein
MVVNEFTVNEELLLRRIESMAIHKLREGPVTMQVSGATVVEGKYGSQVRFDGVFMDDDNASLYISERSAVNQLERIALTVDTCAGETLHFEHVHKDDRTYTNIKRVTSESAPSAPAAPAATPVVSIASTPAAKSSFESKYEQCLGIALQHCEGLAEQGWQVETSDLVAMTATLFIQANRR